MNPESFCSPCTNSVVFVIFDPSNPDTKWTSICEDMEQVLRIYNFFCENFCPDPCFSIIDGLKYYEMLNELKE